MLFFRPFPGAFTQGSFLERSWRARCMTESSARMMRKMGRAWPVCGWGLALCVALAVADARFELAGQIEPPCRAAVAIDGVSTPFAGSVLSDADGRFRFVDLAPGAYTVVVFVPGQGEVRRTIDVGPSLADKKGRVQMRIPFTPSAGSARRTAEQAGKVSVSELAIPQQARNEVAESQKALGKADVDDAIRHLQRALEIAPDFVTAWNNLGTIAYQSRRYEDAEKYFREGLARDAEAFEPMVNLGGVLLTLRRYTQALPYNRFAVLERPDDALANSQLGQNFFYLGEDDKALKHLNEAKRIDPSHFSWPQLPLAEIYARRGDRQAAVRELEDFLARHPDAPNAKGVREQMERLKAK